MVKPIPDGYTAVTPYLVVEHVEKVIDFVKQAFGAQEIERHARPDGVVMHAEVKIGGAILMMGDARGGKWGSRPCNLYLYVPDTDAAYRKALAAGAESMMEPATQFYGDRNAGVKDPAGNFWWIATHVEDVPPEELKRRSQQAMAGSAH